MTSVISLHIGCKQPPVLAQNFDRAYISSLLGHNLYKEPELKQLAGVCPFAGVIEPEKKDERTGFLYGKCAENNSAGFYKSENIWLTPHEVYYKVISQNGLNLRAAASTLGKIVKGLPFRFEGRILKSEGILKTIQGKKGVWVFVEAGGDQGWIFSGFILYSDSFESLHRTLGGGHYNLTTLIGQKGSVTFLTAKNIKHRQISNGWEIIEYETDGANGCDGTDRRKVVFQKDRNFFLPNSATEKITLIDQPIPGIVITKAAPCCACCGGYVDRIYVLGNTQIETFPFSFGKINASCGENMGNMSPHLETRFADNRLMYKIGLPWCFLYDQKVLMTDAPKSTDVMSELFFEVDAGPNARLAEKFPIDAQENWTKAALFEKPK